MPLEEGAFDVDEHIETAPNLIEDETDNDLEANDEAVSDSNDKPTIN